MDRLEQKCILIRHIDNQVIFATKAINYLTRSIVFAYFFEESLHHVSHQSHS